MTADRFANLSKRPKEAKDVERVAFKIDEAAQALGISRTTIYKLVQQQELQTFKIGARTMIRRTMLEEFMRGRERSRAA